MAHPSSKPHLHEYEIHCKLIRFVFEGELFFFPWPLIRMSIQTEPLVNLLLINLDDCPPAGLQFRVLVILYVPPLPTATPLLLINSMKTMALHKNLCVQFGGSLFAIRITTVHSAYTADFLPEQKRQQKQTELRDSKCEYRSKARDVADIHARFSSSVSISSTAAACILIKTYRGKWKLSRMHCFAKKHGE